MYQYIYKKFYTHSTQKLSENSKHRQLGGKIENKMWLICRDQVVIKMCKFCTPVWKASRFNPGKGKCASLVKPAQMTATDFDMGLQHLEDCWIGHTKNPYSVFPDTEVRDMLIGQKNNVLLLELIEKFYPNIWNKRVNGEWYWPHLILNKACASDFDTVVGLNFLAARGFHISNKESALYVSINGMKPNLLRWTMKTFRYTLSKCVYVITDTFRPRQAYKRLEWLWRLFSFLPIDFIDTYRIPHGRFGDDEMGDRYLKLHKILLGHRIASICRALRTLHLPSYVILHIIDLLLDPLYLTELERIRIITRVNEGKEMSGGS